MRASSKTMQKHFMLHVYSQFVLCDDLQMGGTNFEQIHKSKTVNIYAYVYSWSSGTVNGNTPVMQCEALCIPGGTGGKMKTQNMHISLSENQSTSRMHSEKRAYLD